MDFEEAVKKEGRYFAQVFNRLPLLLVRGEGCKVFDHTGAEYLDFFSGIAVSAVGHNHPKVVEALSSQASLLMHASNWVYTEQQLALAERLSKLTGLERAFFTNDGTGAVEAAFKLARKHTGKHEVIAFKNAFHGRTKGALSATWCEKYRKPFEPLVKGVKFAEYDSIESVESLLTDDTAAVIVEPIQGEAGVIVPSDEYLKELRDLTSDKGAVLIVDEVQTGFGRTGSWFEFKRAGIEPDILVLAKGMGGGFPIGAIAYSAMDFETGQHGGTFNGNPLACAVSNAVIGAIDDEGLVENSRKMGDYLMKGLSGFKPHGRGLMIGVDVDDGRGKTLELIKNGVIVIYSGNTLRLLPPLNIGREEADAVLSAFEKVIG
ncbi:MAG: acetylornithine/succinylornithine family transaminase [Candidatus Altiarchaeales archaeon]|nr:acetylornithine/succinylornithine family transaminase [Candidatus Altiarchaeales archaeon]MBD3416211.1 acetylornithine/succinylornithine family transaminase [Candidatus Altiarchaeales archaeon]